MRKGKTENGSKKWKNGQKMQFFITQDRFTTTNVNNQIINM